MVKSFSYREVVRYGEATLHCSASVLAESHYRMFHEDVIVQHHTKPVGKDVGNSNKILKGLGEPGPSKNGRMTISRRITEMLTKLFSLVYA